MTNEESWQQNFELLKAYIEEHHQLPEKMVRQAHQPKRLFEESIDNRSKEHTGEKHKSNVNELTF